MYVKTGKMSRIVRRIIGQLILQRRQDIFREELARLRVRLVSVTFGTERKRVSDGIGPAGADGLRIFRLIFTLSS